MIRSRNDADKRLIRHVSQSFFDCLRFLAKGAR